MAKDLFDKIAEEEKGSTSKGGSKKIILLVLIAVVAVACVAGFLMLYGGVFTDGETIANKDQAADALSGLGNDVNGIAEDLKGMEGNL
jgi:flagellar basal body-associated protein FliL